MQFFCEVRAREGEGEGGEKQPPLGCHPPKPFRASRATTPQATPGWAPQKYKIGPRHSSFC